MTEDLRARAAEALIDEIRMWQVLPVNSAQAMITAACDALVAGVDRPSLRLLAGSRPSDDVRDLLDLANSTAAEVTRSELASSDAIQLDALRVACRRHVDGEWDGRALAAWTYSAIGPGGIGEAGELCAGVDYYHGADEGFMPFRVEDVDAAVLREAHRILRFEPTHAEGAATPGGAAPSRRGVLRWF